MVEEALILSDSINEHYLDRVMDLVEERNVAEAKRLSETIVATKEIQWRLRDVARDLALRPAALDANEAEAFRPLIAMLDAEPDSKSLVRKISGSPNLPEVKSGPSETTEERPEESTAKRTLLLVDDEPNVLTALTRILRPLGYQILTAPNAATAFDILASNQIGVILSDHRMPGMTGVELLSRVKTMYPMTVRMILSGYADISTVSDAIRLGAIYKFMTKPWDQVELCAVLQKAFEKYEQDAQS